MKSARRESGLFLWNFQQPWATRDFVFARALSRHSSATRFYFFAASTSVPATQLSFSCHLSPSSSHVGPRTLLQSAFNAQSVLHVARFPAGESLPGPVGPCRSLLPVLSHRRRRIVAAAPHRRHRRRRLRFRVARHPAPHALPGSPAYHPPPPRRPRRRGSSPPPGWRPPAGSAGPVDGRPAGDPDRPVTRRDPLLGRRSRPPPPPSPDPLRSPPPYTPACGSGGSGGGGLTTAGGCVGQR